MAGRSPHLGRFQWETAHDRAVAGRPCVHGNRCASRAPGGGALGRRERQRAFSGPSAGTAATSAAARRADRQSRHRSPGSGAGPRAQAGRFVGARRRWRLFTTSSWRPASAIVWCCCRRGGLWSRARPRGDPRGVAAGGVRRERDRGIEPAPPGCASPCWRRRGRQEARRRGLTIVYTGNGKGKTTAAIGLAVRAAGNRMRVYFLQFVKGQWKSGEREVLRAIPNVEMAVTGRGFTIERLRDPRIPMEEHQEAAAAGWALRPRAGARESARHGRAGRDPGRGARGAGFGWRSS